MQLSRTWLPVRLMSTLSTLKCRFSVSPSYGLLEPLGGGAGEAVVVLAGVGVEGEPFFGRWPFAAFSASTSLRHLMTISLASLPMSLFGLERSLPMKIPALVERSISSVGLDSFLIVFMSASIESGASFWATDLLSALMRWASSLSSIMTAE